MQRFRCMRSLLMFVAARASVFNHFNCPSSGFSDFSGRFVAEALVRFLFEFMRRRLGAAAADMAISIIRQDHGEDFATIVADMCLLRDDAGVNLNQRTSIRTVLHTRNPGLIEIVKLMSDNIESPLTMEQLSASVSYSARHIERQFQRCLGQTPMGYYPGLRLGYARSLITETDMTLFGISAVSGFNSKAHFSKAFSRRFCVAPSKVNHHRRRVCHPSVGKS